jgi:hypothetical protein
MEKKKNKKKNKKKKLIFSNHTFLFSKNNAISYFVVIDFQSLLATSGNLASCTRGKSLVCI